MTASCLFYPEQACDKNCSVNYHNTRCTESQCSPGSEVDETTCHTAITCNEDSWCFMETSEKCSKTQYAFVTNDFCGIDKDIVDVQCSGNGNLYLKLLLDNKRIVCTSVQDTTILAICECKTCSGRDQSSCSPMVATYCSCISPHENQQITTTSNIQSTTKSPGSVALIGGVIGGIAAVAIVVLLIFVVVWFRKKQSLRRRGNGNSSSNENGAFEEGGTQFRRRKDPVYVNEELSDTVEKENKYYELKPENEAFEEGGTQFRKRDDPVYVNDNISDTFDKENKYYELKPENIVPSGAYDSLFLHDKISRPEKGGKYVNIDSDHNQIQEEISNHDEDDK